MAIHEDFFFTIKKCPGPFKITMGVGHMLEEHRNRLELDFTVMPIGGGAEALGHDKSFKIRFEVALMGATTKWGHGVDEPRNVRFLGRFLILPGLQGEQGRFRYLTPEICSELNNWQWEVVFNASGRDIGFVSKLENPLPKEWTM